MAMKLKWPGFNEKGSVIIALAPESFCFTDNTLVLDGLAFRAKEELHVTLIGSKLGSILQGEIKQNQIIWNRMKETFEEIDWSFRQTGPVHMLSRKKDNMIQKSIIMQIEMPGVTEFYDQLRIAGIIDFETSVPPPHVTLYTHSCPSGIGVSSIEVLNAISVKTLLLDEFKKLLKINPAN